MKSACPRSTIIIDELAKPGRDPREQFEAFSFQEGVNKPEDLKNGMRLPGIVTNVTAFGAFVDVGVHQDGLVHVSQLADNFVKDPSEIVKPGQKVSVTVTEIDLTRNPHRSKHAEQTRSRLTAFRRARRPPIQSKWVARTLFCRAPTS